MTAETLTRYGWPDSEHVPETAAPERDHRGDGGRLRALAVERIYRMRRFKLHAAVYAIVTPLLGILWVLTEYYEEHTWPSRFASDPDVAGTWDPWFFFVAGIWLLILAFHGLRTYLGPALGPIGRYIRRPIGQAELDREIERQVSRG
jgi:hypothetical protein